MSDTLGVIATPHSVIDRKGATGVIVELVEEHDVGTIVLGLPTSLGGGETQSAADARNFGEELRRRSGVDVVYWDERFTTRMAERSLLESGMKRRERRGTVDKVAAAIILQSYLDSDK